MPKRGRLPETLQALTRRNAAPVDSGRDFHPHVDRLIRSLDRVFLEARQKADQERLAREEETRQRTERERIAREEETHKAEEELRRQAEARKAAEQERIAQEEEVRQKAERDRIAQEEELSWRRAREQEEA